MAQEISGNYGSRNHVAKTQSTWADYDKQKLEKEKKPVHINSIWNIPTQANAINS